MSELAYGSEKAKDLFRDMMEKANDEYGFDAENIPLMIEAIPVSGECIVLIITKVEDPEELDTRFSKFAPGISDSSEDDAEADDSADTASISDLFKRFKDATSPKAENNPVNDPAFEGMAFSFGSITELATVCKTADKFFSGISSLYYNKETGEYLLTVNRGKMDITDFVQACNLFSEYGAPLHGKTISESFLREHCEALRLETAISDLAEIG